MTLRMSENQKKSYHQWRAILLDWKQSDMTQTVYCAKNGLNLRTFRYMRKKLGNLRESDINSETTSKLKIVQVQQEIGSSDQVGFFKTGPSLKLQIGTISVEVTNNFNPDTLLKLIRVLQAV